MSFWDTIAIGDATELGDYLFTADEITRFAARFDPQPFHLDEEAARQSLFGGLCASGWHTTAIFMKLNVAAMEKIAAQRRQAGLDQPVLGPSPGLRDLRWLRPVFAGDRLAYRSEVAGKRLSRSRPGWGLLESRVTAANQNGQAALSFMATLFLRTD